MESGERKAKRFNHEKYEISRKNIFSHKARVDIFWVAGDCDSSPLKKSVSSVKSLDIKVKSDR